MLFLNSCHRTVLDRSSTSQHILVGCWACRFDQIISLGGSTTSQQLLQHLPHVLFLRNYQVPVFISAITLGLQFKSCSNSAARGRKTDMNNHWYKSNYDTEMRTGEHCRGTISVLTENWQMVSTVLGNYCLLGQITRTIGLWSDSTLNFK